MMDRALAEMCRFRPDLCPGDWTEIGFYTLLTILVIGIIIEIRRGY